MQRHCVFCLVVVVRMRRSMIFRILMRVVHSYVICCARSLKRGSWGRRRCWRMSGWLVGWWWGLRSGRWRRFCGRFWWVRWWWRYEVGWWERAIDERVYLCALTSSISPMLICDRCHFYGLFVKKIHMMFS
jgi:hypothetical protein